MIKNFLKALKIAKIGKLFYIVNVGFVIGFALGTMFYDTSAMWGFLFFLAILGVQTSQLIIDGHDNP